MIEQEEYDNVVVAYNRYTIETQVRIIEDTKYNTSKNTKGLEQNEHAHLVLVYVLLDEYKAYGSSVRVK
jgi:hypothetical protein